MSPTFTNSPYSMASTATPCTDPCVSTCPSCGGLQCLCRPRFFAGQLLTEDDLSLLNNYIVEKNKLHNRYLHGWGVVCGMEVVCSPCNNLVTVKSGYALSPCGEDIVVCQDTAVNICALVQKCKTQLPPDCQPLALGAQDACSSTTEDWILFIRYSESMSRGVTPLKGASGNTCSTNCNCGGSSSCGCGGKSSCGCGGSTSSKSNGNGKGCSCGCSGSKTSTQTSSTALAQCEPTAVCEGYTFDVCKAPVPDRKTTDRGALINRVLCCIEAILPELTQPPQDPAQWQQWCCSLRQNLLTFFVAHPIHDCQIATLLANMCNGNNQDPRVAVAQILWEYILDCICSAFLPPCPCPVSDDRVPIATITIQKTPSNPCQLVKVCNLDVRKFCTTFPALQYWLSPFGSFARGLRTGLANLCCTIPQIPQANIDRPQQNPQINVARANAINIPPNPMTEFSNLLVSSFLERSQSVNAQSFALASLGLTHDGGQAFMSPTDLSHPFEAIFLNQVAWPVLETALPSNLSGVLREVIASVGKAGAPAAGDSAATMNDLKSQIGDLQSTLKQQQSKLDELQKELKKK